MADQAACNRKRLAAVWQVSVEVMEYLHLNRT